MQRNTIDLISQTYKYEVKLEIGLQKVEINKINRQESVHIEQEQSSDACFSLNKQTFSKICVFKSNATCVTGAISV